MASNEAETETAIDKLRRMAGWLNYEPESMLQDLPTIAALEEYFDLWETYGADFSEGVVEAIEVDGADPAAWNAFVAKHDLARKGWRHLRRQDPLEPGRTGGTGVQGMFGADAQASPEPE